MTNERGRSTSELSRGRWILCWMALLLVAIALYLLPFTYPGERLILLLFQVGLWVGAIALVWRHRYLRLGAFAVALFQLFPIRSGLTRSVLLAGFALLWIGLLIVSRKRREAVAILALAPGLFLVFLLLPGRAVDAALLRREYVRSLQPYRGAVYIWGGENRIGIDCSGLVRCGWIDANLRVGLRSANPGPVRQALLTWLQDCSAKELGEGYRGRTDLVLTTRSLNHTDYSRILPGDIAVADNGLHTLAYIGSQTWIEAEPNFNGVAVIHVPEPHNPWYETSMRILRWRTLE
jgi:hypothetical protein